MNILGGDRIITFRHDRTEIRNEINDLRSAKSRGWNSLLGGKILKVDSLKGGSKSRFGGPLSTTYCFSGEKMEILFRLISSFFL